MREIYEENERKKVQQDLDDIKNLELLKQEKVEFGIEVVTMKESNMEERIMNNLNVIYKKLVLKFEKRIELEKLNLKKSFHLALKRGLENVMGEILFKGKKELLLCPKEKLKVGDIDEVAREILAERKRFTKNWKFGLKKLLSKDDYRIKKWLIKWKNREEMDDYNYQKSTRLKIIENPRSKKETNVKRRLLIKVKKKESSKNLPKLYTKPYNMKKNHVHDSLSKLGHLHLQNAMKKMKILLSDKICYYKQKYGNTVYCNIYIKKW
jgi:hypothetical protein